MNETTTQKKIYLNQYIISDPSGDAIFIKDFTVTFYNEEKGIQQPIVEKNGTICDFPGIECCERLTQELGDCSIDPIVKYEAVFQPIEDDRFMMVWTVRPDGRYWMDSWGFGAEDYESVSLYTYIDPDGHFTAPFRLYSIGYDVYGEHPLRRSV